MNRMSWTTGLLAVALLGVFSESHAAPPAAYAKASKKDKERVVVMYFHRTQRCPTCLKMGSYAEEAVKKGFAKEIKDGRVAFHFIDFQDAKNAAYVKAYRIEGPSLIVAKATGEKVAAHKDLEEMWTKVREKDDFLKYVRANVQEYLKGPRKAE